MKAAAVDTIDDYIATFPGPVQKLLTQMRRAIRTAAPEASEAIKYGMPTFVHQGNLVHFGGFTHHIGFYATPTGHASFEKELAPYKSGKGSVQFPIGQPLPLELVRRIVAFRVKENEAKAAKKKKAKA